MRFRPVTMLPRLPPLSATRSTVAGVESGNFSQPPSSGPAMALVLNQSSCVVIHTCEYCAGVLAVTDISVRAEQPAREQARPADATIKPAGERLFMPIPVRERALMMLRRS